MNSATRVRVVEIAARHGFVAQTKPDGSDNYVKNLMFRHSGVRQTVYVGKETGMNAAGDANEYTIAVHPQYFKPHFERPSLGIERTFNARKGGYLFASSNYQAFPSCPGSNQPCGMHLHAPNNQSLEQLFALLAGKEIEVAADIDAKTPSDRAPAPRVRIGHTVREPVRVRFEDSAPGGELSGLVIRAEPIQQILRGEKDWEMRSKAVHKRGRIALIQKGTGQVVGVANLVDCLGPMSDEEMLEHWNHHRIPRELLHSVEVAKWRTAWVLEQVQRLAKPISYVHRSGAVTWVTLDRAVSRDVLAQVDSL